MVIDRQRVRSAFDQHAWEYDRYAAVQKRVVNRLLHLLPPTLGEGPRILDIGSGTGMLLGELAALAPGASLVGIDLARGMAANARQRLAGNRQVQLVTGDGERLPFPAGTFDLVVSTSTFQWLDTLDTVLGEAARVLKPGGACTFALFGSGTLHELRDSYRLASIASGRGEEARTQSFFCREEVAAALARAGFADCSVSVEEETEIHPDVPALLRSIRRIGAGNPSRVVSKGLSERRVMLEMMAIYQRTYGGEGGIPATYEVIYGKGVKG